MTSTTNVQVTQSKTTTITNNRNEPSIVVPPSTDSRRDISSIGLETKKNINTSNNNNNSGYKGPQIDNYIQPKVVQ